MFPFCRPWDRDGSCPTGTCASLLAVSIQLRTVAVDASWKMRLRRGERVAVFLLSWCPRCAGPEQHGARTSQPPLANAAWSWSNLRGLKAIPWPKEVVAAWMGFERKNLRGFQLACSGAR